MVQAANKQLTRMLNSDLQLVNLKKIGANLLKYQYILVKVDEKEVTRDEINYEENNGKEFFLSELKDNDKGIVFFVKTILLFIIHFMTKMEYLYSK